MLGGTVTKAAAAIGITPSAVTQWPEVLPPRLVDRVHAAIARRTLPAEALGLTPPPEPAKAPAIEDQEQRIVETIDNAAHVMQRAMQELNQLRRLRGVA